MEPGTKQAVKFTFDTVFDETGGSAEPVAPQKKKTRWTAEEVEEIRRAAHAEGYAEGQGSVEAAAAKSSAAALERLGQIVETLFAGLTDETQRTMADATKLAWMTARKLATALIEKQPAAEIEAVFAECLGYLNREPHILLRVSDQLVDQLRERVDGMAKARGIADKVILFGDPAIAVGDCQVEWADGGTYRSWTEISSEIDEVITRYVQTLTQPGRIEDRAESNSIPESGPGDLSENGAENV